MAEEGLRARAPRAARYSSYAGEEGRAAAPNLLLVDAGRDLHDFSAAAPGEVLVTDITEFRLPDDPRKVYLSPGRRPVRRRRRRLLGGHLAVQGARGRDARRRRGRRRGRPSRSTATAAGTTAPPTGSAPAGEAGVERSMSRKGHSPDNAACEGFFGRLKVEFFHGRDWRGGVSAERFAAEPRRVDPLVPGGEAEGVRRGRAQGVRYDSRPAGGGWGWPPRPSGKTSAPPSGYRNIRIFAFPCVFRECAITPPLAQSAKGGPVSYT